MLDAEVVEDADDGAAQILAAVAVVVVGDRGDQRVEPALDVAVVKGRERAAERRVVAEADAGGKAVGRERAADVGEEAERLLVVAALVQQPGERERRVGAAGIELDRAPQRLLVAGLDEPVGLATATARRRSAATCGGGCAPTNSATIWPSLNALTAGMPWMPNAAASCWLASVSSLASATSPSCSFASASSTGVSWRHGPHHSAQKSTTTGISCERSMTSCSKVASVVSKITTTRMTGSGRPQG